MIAASSKKPAFSVNAHRLDLNRLGECLHALHAADIAEFHLDVADGTFVPGFGLSLETIEAVGHAIKRPRHVHLMIDRPERYIPRLAALGCSGVTVHIEACIHAHRTITQIRELGMAPGVALNPGNALTKLEYVLPLVDRVLLPVYEYGADRDRPPSAAYERVRILRENLDYLGTGAQLHVEGNLTSADAARMIAHGADAIVIDRLDVLHVEPLEAQVRRYMDEVAAAHKLV